MGISADLSHCDHHPRGRIFDLNTRNVGTAQRVILKSRPVQCPPHIFDRRTYPKLQKASPALASDTSVGAEDTTKRFKRRETGLCVPVLRPTKVAQGIENSRGVEVCIKCCDLGQIIEVTEIFQVAVCKLLFYDRINSILTRTIHPSVQRIIRQWLVL